jgi:hypothetical protein
MRGRAEFTLLASLVVAACGGRSPLAGVVPSDEPSPDASGGPPIECAPPVDVYAPNLVKEGSKGRFAFELLESRPAPPQRGLNTFFVQVRDASGPVFVDLSVAPRVGRSRAMGVPPTITFDPTSATYTVDGVYLFLYGAWKIDMSARPAGSDAGPALDSTEFVFCVVES